MRATHATARAIAWIAALAALSGTALAAPTVLFDFEAGLKRMPKASKIVNEPVHSGQKALQWDLATGPTWDLRDFDTDWSKYTKLTFWAYSDKKHDWKMPMVFVSEGGYFMTKVDFGFTGWKQIEVPLAKCSKAHKPQGWDLIKSIGFRAKGYGLPEVPEGMTLVLDDFALE